MDGKCGETQASGAECDLSSALQKRWYMSTRVTQPNPLPNSHQEPGLYSTISTQTEKRVLGQLIRAEYHAIHASKSKANKPQASMHRRSDQYQRLNDLVNAAAHASKTKWKSSLKQKFKRLTESREQPDGTLLLGPGCVPNSPQTSMPDNVTERHRNLTQRVSILGDISVSEQAVSLLAKGPKFAITPKFTKKGLQQKLQTEIAVLAYGIRWKAAGERIGTGIGGTFDPIKSECPFKIRRKAPPRDIDPAERSIKGFITDMERIMRTAGKWQNPKPNISHADRHALKELREREDIVVTRSDKGGEMVIMKAEDMQELCREHLADSTTYCKLQKDPTLTLRLTINKALEKILRSRDFPKIIIR